MTVKQTELAIFVQSMSEKGAKAVANSHKQKL